LRTVHCGMLPTPLLISLANGIVRIPDRLVPPRCQGHTAITRPSVGSMPRSVTAIWCVPVPRLRRMRHRDDV
jgi:hypothetical protein